MAVAAGQFGAIPIAMPGETEIELAEDPTCDSSVAQVRSGVGQYGWIPFDALPRRLMYEYQCFNAASSLPQETVDFDIATFVVTNDI